MKSIEIGRESIEDGAGRPVEANSLEMSKKVKDLFKKYLGFLEYLKKSASRPVYLGKCFMKSSAYERLVQDGFQEC